MLVLIALYKPHDTSFLDQIGMMSTVFGMKHTYSVKISICKVLCFVNGVQAEVIVTHNSIIYY